MFATNNFWVGANCALGEAVALTRYIAFNLLSGIDYLILKNQ